MGLFDFDFSAVERILNTMSDEEKQQMMDTAANMMSAMNTDAMKSEAEEIREEQEEETSLEDFLSLDDETLSNLNGTVLEKLEAAMDLEQYYEDVDTADLSASALFYAKAVLALLRAKAAPILDAAGIPGFASPAMTTLANYVQAFGNPEVQAVLIEKGADAASLESLASRLMRLPVFLQRAEYDIIRKDDLQVLKALLIEEGLLKDLGALKA